MFFLPKSSLVVQTQRSILQQFGKPPHRQNSRRALCEVIRAHEIASNSICPIRIVNIRYVRGAHTRRYAYVQNGVFQPPRYYGRLGALLFSCCSPEALWRSCSESVHKSAKEWTSSGDQEMFGDFCLRIRNPK